jgi:hypothetical protein
MLYSFTRHGLGRRSDDHHAHPAGLRVVEVAADVGIVVLSEIDDAAGHNLDTGVLELFPAVGELLGRIVIGKMKFLNAREVDVEVLDHLDGEVALESAQRVAGNRQLDLIARGVGSLAAEWRQSERPSP